MSGRPYAAAAQKNGAAILGVLRVELAGRRRILEIGSGTGQHAVSFCREMPGLTWQTSDLPVNHAGIRAWIEASALPNVLAPLDLDVRRGGLHDCNYDAVYTANTAHIMALDAVERMFGVASEVLRGGSPFLLYGPMRRRERDRSLRSLDPHMGIRDLEQLDDIAARCRLQRQRIYAMPANNHLAVWIARESE